MWRPFFLLLLLGVAPLASAEPAALPPAFVIDATASPHARLRPLPLDAVQWTQGFWAERWKQLDEVTLPEMWRLLADPQAGHVLDNFRIAAGRAGGKYAGTNWQDEWLYKWIEAAACVWRQTREPWIAGRMNEGIALIAAAQQPDGYLSTKIIAGKLPRFTNPNDHEFYNMGHLLTAAVIHYRMTGDDSLLKVARKNADFLCATLGVTVDPFMAHNPSVIMGLAEMYRLTGEKKYLACAQLVVDRRGTKPQFPYKLPRPNAPEAPGSDLIQDRVPVRDSTEMAGQNVFSTYLYAGACDVEAEIGDAPLGAALDRLWADLTTRKMFVHGGISALSRGVSHNAMVYESVGAPYELPNSTGYNETCGQVGAFMWSARMLTNEPDSGFADVMEREMFNGFLGGVGLDGRSWFYRNVLRRYDADYKPTGAESGPLTDMVLRNQPGMRNICCPTNLLRTFAELSSYFYSRDVTGLWVHLYGGNRIACQLADGAAFALEQKTDYPWSGEILFTLQQAPSRPVTLHLRIPGWSSGPQLKVNGLPVEDFKIESGYVALTQTWQAGDTIALSLPMPVQLVEGNPAIEQTRNQIAVMRGPLVYCAESTDLPAGVSLPEVYLSGSAAFTLGHGLPGDAHPLANEIVTLQTAALDRSAPEWHGLYRPLNPAALKPVTLRLVPYYAWSNRGKSAMSVWLPVVLATKS